LSETIENLNKQVANWAIIHVKLHHYHWNVKGENFFALHQKFETLYDYAADQLDLMAERILALGGRPLGTMKSYLELTSLRESSGRESYRDMVGHITNDFVKIAGEIKEAIATSQNEKDEATASLLTETVTELEKQIWMLKAFLS
jgi:starvation-inducible DNA-binding protein